MREHDRLSHVNPYIAWRGFEQLGWETVFFAKSELKSLVDESQITRETPVVGGIPAILEALELLGCARPEMDALPQSLQSFAGRRVWKQTLAQVRAHIVDEGPSLFVKPLPRDHKLFNGHVVRAFRDLIETSGVDSQTEVLCSEVVDFQSEYRGFVHHRELVGFRHYAGDFRFYPDMNLVDEGLKSFADKPVACSMDWGVTSDGRTLLVEVNDGYALGTYGLDPLFYAPMMRDRWFEMTQK